MGRFLLYTVGSFFGTGTAPFAPASVASLAFAALWWWLAPVPLVVHLVALVATVAIGIPIATRMARLEGREDPSVVVIDEVAGMLVTYLGVAGTGVAPWLVGFFWFRVFDVLKPLGVRRLEKLPGGTGIMADDLGAGVLACLATHATMRYVIS